MKPRVHLKTLQFIETDLDPPKGLGDNNWKAQGILANQTTIVKLGRVAAGRVETKLSREPDCGHKDRK